LTPSCRCPPCSSRAQHLLEEGKREVAALVEGGLLLEAHKAALLCAVAVQVRPDPA